MQYKYVYCSMINASICIRYFLYFVRVGQGKCTYIPSSSMVISFSLITVVFLNNIENGPLYTINNVYPHKPNNTDNLIKQLKFRSCSFFGKFAFLFLRPFIFKPKKLLPILFIEEDWANQKYVFQIRCSLFLIIIA